MEGLGLIKRVMKGEAVKVTAKISNNLELEF
jgi:hypothetical protein